MLADGDFMRSMHITTAVILLPMILLATAVGQSRSELGGSADQERTVLRIEQHGEALFKQKKFTEARPLLSKACASGRWDACDLLTIMYIEGLGGLPTRSSMAGAPFSNAVSVFQRECDRGEAVACSHLGYMYENAIGVPENFANKQAFYSKGCDGGDGFACDDLGIERDVKCGMKSASDCPVAVSLYAKSCDLGYAQGCQHLGSMYHRGAGVERDDVRAESLFRKACSAGAAGACRELETMRMVR
jgi:TPR repeat protein